MRHRNCCASILALCLAPLIAQANTIVCVHDVNEFQTALTNAQTSTDPTLIEVVRGSYDLGGSTLTFESTVLPQLDISGGYNGDCSAQIQNPALTVVDGQYLSSLLAVNTYGGLSVRFLTFQHGSGTGFGPGLYADLYGTGGLIIHYNIFRQNTGTNDVALYALMDNFSTGDVHLDDNLFVDNSATQYLPAGEVQIYGAGAVYANNNTVSRNTISTSPPPGYGGLGVFASTATLSNNIFWANDVNGVAVTSAVFVDNDIGTLQGTMAAGSSGNVSVDPQFASSSDFHLLPTSPVLGQGTLTPAGTLTTIDIEGHARTFNGTVDVGAFERGDEIFAYNFDD